MRYKKTTNGYFASPHTGIPQGFQRVCVDHLQGKKLPGVWGFLFWWVRVPQYQLLRDVLYVTPEGNPLLIKTGFVYNGGSVPFLLWSIYPPDQSDCFAAFLVHDWLCSPPYYYSSKESHQILKHACLANGAYVSTASIIWFFVRMFGPRFEARKCEDSEQG